MRVTIVPRDGVVSIDGEARGPFDLSYIDREVSAVQWYDTWGEVELADVDSGHVHSNVRITDLAPYARAVSSWVSCPPARTTVETLPVTVIA